MNVLNYEQLEQAMIGGASAYRSADPFPHIVIDDFLTPELVSQFAALFPKPRVKPGQEDRSADTADGVPAQFRKRWVSREMGVDIAFRRLYWELNAGPFVSLLEGMSGINHILPDPHLLGGGVHQTEAGGFLRIHADFNRHPAFGLDRRLNLLIYFNPDWELDWGGDLELWSEDMTSCRQQIAPVAGRCVIFNTTSTSFHGHPHPLDCPPGITRKSLALYYYTHSADVVGEGHDTLWQQLPEELA